MPTPRRHTVSEPIHLTPEELDALTGAVDPAEFDAPGQSERADDTEED